MTDRHFTIDMLPAFDGDCLWVEWGEPKATSRMLIDGGRGGERLPEFLADAFAARSNVDHVFDLVVNTHMDADHIAGMIGLFSDRPESFATTEVWFNAFRHLPPDDVLGWKQSDRLEELIEAHVLKTDTVWNQRIGNGGAIAVADVPEEGDPEPLPVTIINGLTLTLLSPTVDKLKRVARKWPEEVRRARLDVTAEGDELVEEDLSEDDILGYDEDKGVEPAELATRPYQRDSTPANGASIAFIADFGGRRVLFAGDAHAEVLEESLRRYQPNGPVELDAFKLSHHGSEKNLSPDLLAMVDCPTWLISTNGNLHNHPDRRAVSRLVTRRRPTHLVCNYRSDDTEYWGWFTSQSKYNFTAYLPPRDEPGVRFDVMADDVTAASTPLPKASS